MGKGGAAKVSKNDDTTQANQLNNNPVKNKFGVIIVYFFVIETNKETQRHAFKVLSDAFYLLLMHKKCTLKMSVDSFRK